jgi:DoxX-like family
MGDVDAMMLSPPEGGGARMAVAGAGRSGSAVRACLVSMHIAYVAVTIVVALANGYAAVLNFAGAESVRVVADEVRVSPGWMIPFGILLACGAVGLLAGFAVPVLGMAAATGLVVYFTCAVSAHIRVRDPNVTGAVGFLVMAVAALVVGLGYHHHW